MSIIMKLRQARNVEQIAAELEPLAVSLATLADQAQSSIRNLEEASQRQGREWSEHQSRAASEVAQAAAHVTEQVRNLQQATAKLQSVAQEIGQAQRDQFWHMAAMAATAGILAAVLATVFMLWLVPEPTVQNTLDPKAVAEHLKPALQEALKRR